jgi:hypothetical protein
MILSVLLPSTLALASTPGVCDFNVVIHAVPDATGTPKVTLDPSTVTSTENGAYVCWTFDNTTPDHDLVAAAEGGSGTNHWVTDPITDQGSGGMIDFIGPNEFDYIATIGHFTGLPGARTYEVVASTSGTLCIGCSTTTTSSTQSSGGGLRVPEFPPQLGIPLLFTALLVGSYLLARRVSPNGKRP